MISFRPDPRTLFQHRAAAVIEHRGRVLLHRAPREPFWSLPGGRVELLEPAAAALRRELREETGTDASVGRLLWVVENFFPLDDLGVPGGRAHELGFYFAARLPEGSPLLDPSREHRGVEEGADGTLELIFRWFPRAELPATRIYPSFLREGLLEPPLATVHLVHEDVAEPPDAEPLPPPPSR